MSDLSRLHTGVRAVLRGEIVEVSTETASEQQALGAFQRRLRRENGRSERLAPSPQSNVWVTSRARESAD